MGGQIYAIIFARRILCGINALTLIAVLYSYEQQRAIIKKLTLQGGWITLTALYFYLLFILQRNSPQKFFICLLKHICRRITSVILANIVGCLVIKQRILFILGHYLYTRKKREPISYIIYIRTIFQNNCNVLWRLFI